jgi:hypothetical protein
MKERLRQLRAVQLLSRGTGYSQAAYQDQTPIPSLPNGSPVMDINMPTIQIEAKM